MCVAAIATPNTSVELSCWLYILPLKNVVAVELALTGRVPCKVIGKVAKGDMLVTSAIPGYAIVDNDPKLGTVIGKAVGTKDDDGRGVVEVVVGRL